MSSTHEDGFPSSKNHEEIGPSTSSSEPKKSNRKKKKQRVQEDQGGDTDMQDDNMFPDDGVMRQLKLLDESDIIRTNRKPNIFTITNSHGILRNSSNNGKVYMEVKGGFRAVDQMKLMNSRLGMASSPGGVQPEVSKQEAALGVQSWFRRVATLSHGILAGLALCQAVTVWLLAPPHHTWQDFVEHYTHIAYPFYASSHFLLIISVISVFDRYDVCKFQWSAIREQISCRLELLTLLLYPLALGLALIGSDRDIRLAQFHKTDSTIWWEDREYTELQLDEWKYLILAKCIAVIIGWLLLGMNPVWDQFYHRLKDTKEA